MFKEGLTTLVVQVQPNARQNQITRFEDGIWHLRIAAPPVKGKANQMLIKFLSDILDTSKGNLSIEKGTSSKRKTVAIKGLSQNKVVGQLKKSL